MVRKTGLWRYELTEGPYEQAVQSPKHKVMLFTGIAYAQLYDFRNYSYEPETDVVALYSPRADKLISQL